MLWLIPLHRISPSLSEISLKINEQLSDVLLYLQQQCSGLFPAGDTYINLVAVSRLNYSSSLHITTVERNLHQ